MGIFVDSGAPAIYKLYIRKKKMKVVMGSTFKDRINDDFSFLNSSEYKEYFKEYVSFLKKNKKYISIYCNLDIINNPEATYENQKLLEKEGLKPIPVFHLGSDESWLNRYIQEGYRYIAIGGITPNTFEEVQEPLDHIWLNYLVDKKGYPKVKVHGFAVTSSRLIHRYPWYSVDSSSWVKMGRCGILLVPKTTNGKYDYSKPPYNIFVTKRTPYRKEKGKHIENVSKQEQVKILNYIREKGFRIGKSKIVEREKGYKPRDNEVIIENKKDKVIVERVIKDGVSNNNLMRDLINLKYYFDLCNSVPPWPWPIKFKQASTFFKK